MEDAHARWRRFRRAIEGERLPLAVVDLDALDANVDVLLGPVARAGKTLRVATKSLRTPALFRAIAARGGPSVRGLMTYDAAETAWLASEGFEDLLLAYPTVQRADVEALVAVNVGGKRAAVIVDCGGHLDALEGAAAAHGAPPRSVPVVVDVDVSFRPVPIPGARDRVHLGVRRSPLRDADDVLTLHGEILRRPHLRFEGVMGYEAQIAGLPDRSLAERAFKRASAFDVARTRAQIARALAGRGASPAIFNGGGSGSVRSSSKEEALTEVTAGSGFVCSHLFSGYRDLPLTPAAFFALQVTRVPRPGIVTCHGGGFVASGPAGEDRLPIPVLPAGLSLLPLEGAGEVQTPLEVPFAVTLRPGDPVFFRHAKAGELAEHVNEYLFVRGDRVVERARTYRGSGKCFLG